MHLCRHAVFRLAYVKEVDPEDSLSESRHLPQKKEGAAIIYADLGHTAGIFLLLLSLENRKKYQCIRRIQVALNSPQIAENKFVHRGHDVSHRLQVKTFRAL